jgi:hypothetical protein
MECFEQFCGKKIKVASIGVLQQQSDKKSEFKESFNL